MSSPTMLVLPPLALASVPWRLPLCDATAMELAHTVVEEDVVRRSERLAAALAVDPALAVWARLQAKELGSDGNEAPAIDRVPPLAQWLAAQSSDRFDWGSTIPVAIFSTEQQSRFAALVAESVGAAREATRGFPSDFAVLQPTYLAALTARCREWLKVANPEQPWAEPMGATAGMPENMAGSGEALSVEARLTADEAWRRWLTEIPGVQSLLPALVAQSRRLSELQSNFSATLQSAKLDAMKEFAYGAGHELNNPLANIASRSQTLLADEPDPERRRRLAAINTQAFRAHEMLADMMLFARPPQPRFEPIDVVRLVGEVLAGLAEDAAAQETMVQRLGDNGPRMIEADPTQLRVALRALCINSLEALGRGGQVTIEVKGSGFRVQEGSGVGGHGSVFPTPPSPLHPFTPSPLHPPIPSPIQITVSDDGPGISPEIREKIFDPFFSGREAGRGLGFGLSKCWRIVTMHGGQIEVESQPPHGAKFIITLPACQINKD